MNNLKTNQNSVPVSAADIAKIMNAIKQVANEVKVPTVVDAVQPDKAKPASKLKDIAGKALKVAGAVAPSLASLIPGVGPVVSQILSTLNDDEWFSEFKGNGAAFSQYLKLTVEGDGDSAVLREAFAGMAIIPTDVPSFDRALASNPQPNEHIYAQFMPSVLSYVRKKTNNVLADDTYSYYEAFYYAACILALYYTGKKYLELSTKLPLNIPDLPSVLQPIAPANISIFTGMIESLGDWIRTTVRLPYAFTEYLRWRFGTVFESENTGKPGLIMYDYHTHVGSLERNGLGTAPLDFWLTTVATLKDKYIACGKAGADLKLAYEDHEQRLDVEKRHYDEKEFNLRCNFSYTDSLILHKDNAMNILLDSRLDMNAAIQAVTISSRSAGFEKFEADNSFASARYYVPFATHAPIIYFYIDLSSYNILRAWFDRLGVVSLYEEKYKNGWNSIQYRGEFNDVLQQYVEDALIYGDEGSKESLFAYFNDSLAIALVQSLQLHNKSSYFALGYDGDVVNDPNKLLVVQATPLSYDIARMNFESIANIQRAAIRNLTRGEYKTKTPVGVKNEVKTSIKELAETMDK